MSVLDVIKGKDYSFEEIDLLQADESVKQLKALLPSIDYTVSGTINNGWGPDKSEFLERSQLVPNLSLMPENTVEDSVSSLFDSLGKEYWLGNCQGSSLVGFIKLVSEFCKEKSTNCVFSLEMNAYKSIPNHLPIKILIQCSESTTIHIHVGTWVPSFSSSSLLFSEVI